MCLYTFGFTYLFKLSPLYIGCRVLQWWCSCYCCCHCCCLYWKSSYWDGSHGCCCVSQYIFVEDNLKPMGGIGKTEVPFWCDPIPCIMIPGLIKQILALWANVLHALCLAVMKWLLSQCKYWSVCVGFFVDCCVEGVFGTCGDWGVHKRKCSLLGWFFYCNLYVWILTVYVL